MRAMFLFSSTQALRVNPIFIEEHCIKTGSRNFFKIQMHRPSLIMRTDFSSRNQDSRMSSAASLEGCTYIHTYLNGMLNGETIVRTEVEQSHSFSPILMHAFTLSSSKNARGFHNSASESVVASSAACGVGFAFRWNVTEHSSAA